ncbi:MAG TPA: hypothetical protein VH681_02560, partial [Nitrospiraceae bacterium]
MNEQEFQALWSILKDTGQSKATVGATNGSLGLQREQVALVQRQAERHERIQDRAEYIQEKGAQMMAVARKTLFVLLPIVTLLIIYVSWI